MKYYRCKCGKMESWCSGMTPSPCKECDECHTTVAGGPDGHKRAVPHDWVGRDVETDEGDKTLTYCRWCMCKKKDLENV